jgi:hypothetical protein
VFSHLKNEMNMNLLIEETGHMNQSIVGEVLPPEEDTYDGSKERYSPPAGEVSSYNNSPT